MEDFFLVCMLGIIFIGTIAALFWAYEDAENRGQSGCLVTALILFTGLPGILIWLVIRNSLQSPSSQPLATQKCPLCAKKIQVDAVFCGYCGNGVKV
ncbi:MAG: hypothetical protein AAF490_01725 [Chloroflexota bacterium]